MEDKRLELEQKHTALSAKYKSLSTTYQITKKQLIELKVSLTVILLYFESAYDISMHKETIRMTNVGPESGSLHTYLFLFL